MIMIMTTIMMMMVMIRILDIQQYRYEDHACMIGMIMMTMMMTMMVMIRILDIQQSEEGRPWLQRPQQRGSRADQIQL